MRLLVILPAYEPAYGLGGGVLSTMATLCRALAGIGVSVTVYTTNASGTAEPLSVPLGEPIDRGGVEVLYFKSTFGPASMFDSRDLLTRLRQTVARFDVVYIAAWFMWLGIEAAKICRKAGVPVIAGIHGGFTTAAKRKSRLRKELFWRLFIRRAIASAAAVHLTCPAEQRRSHDWLNGVPAMIVPGPVDPAEFQPCPSARPEFRAQCGISADAPVLISVTRFDWMKRIDLLINALDRLPIWRLVLVGDHHCGTGPDMQRLAKKIGVNDRITWTGFLDKQRIAQALSAADIAALISESDNFGNVVVEAMMCGLPVLVSPQVGVHEMIADQQFCLTAQTSVDSIVHVLSRFEADRWRRRDNADAIRRFAIEQFSPKVVAEQFLAQLERFVAAPA